MKLRHALFAVDAKFKKKYDEDESDLDDDFVEEWETQQEEKEIEKAQKKFEKDNEKAVEEGKEPQVASILEKKIKAIKDEFKDLAKERGTKKAATKGKSTDKLEDSIAKLSEKIRSAKQTIIDKDAGKEVALGTRFVFPFNWRSPTDIVSVKSTTWILGRICLYSPLHSFICRRITAAWCKTNDVPIEKLFSKTLVTKCRFSCLFSKTSSDETAVPWAMEVEDDWKF